MDDLLQQVDGVVQDSLRTLTADAAFAELHLLSDAAHVVEDVAGVLDREVTVAHERCMDGLGRHTQQLDTLVRPNTDDVEQGVLNVAAEDIAGHELCGRHVLERGLRENLAGHLRLREFQQETVLQARIHLESVTQAHLLLGQTSQ